MRRSIFFSFVCIDLKFCKQPRDHCRITNHGLDLNYKVRMRRSVFFSFAYIDLKLLTQASFLSRPQFRRLGYGVSALKYVETARLIIQ